MHAYRAKIQSRFSRKRSLKRKIFILYFRLLFSRRITPFPLVPPVTNYPVYLHLYLNVYLTFPFSQRYDQSFLSKYSDHFHSQFNDRRLSKWQSWIAFYVAQLASEKMEKETGIYRKILRINDSVDGGKERRNFKETNGGKRQGKSIARTTWGFRRVFRLLLSTCFTFFSFDSVF